MSFPSPRPDSADLSQQLAQLDAALDAARRARMASTRAEHALDAFSQAVSHDLRAPVRAIQGYATALVEDCGDTLTVEGRRFIERIVAAADTLEERVDALLRLSHLGRAGVRRDPVNLSGLAQRVVDDLRRIDPTRVVTVEVTPGLEAMGDAALLAVALENLIGNAWKFTREVADARIVVTGVDGHDGPVFRVADNGIGFDMSHASRLFVPFQRLHPGAAYEGTGVGLASTRRIIERHGGRIWATARPQVGATFFFTLLGGGPR